MMREIKFRAWDTRLNEWLGTPFFINPENGKVHEWADTGLEGYDIPSAILMQYTGLKDKNGTEIYEGDIVEAEVITGEIINLPVEYKAPQWQPSMYLSNCKVIGNIYENKELLA